MLDKKRLVLLDDDEICNFYNKDVIEEFTIFENIEVYTNPMHLLSVLSFRIENAKKLPGVFLVDVNMPEMDGFEFLEKLNKLINGRFELPEIYILTSSSHKKDKERFEQNKLAKGYLLKPLIPDIFKQELNVMMYGENR